MRRRTRTRTTDDGVRKMEVYIFIRKEGFYPVELRDDDDAKRNAEINPGTLRVEDLNGRVVWKPN